MKNMVVTIAVKEEYGYDSHGLRYRFSLKPKAQSDIAMALNQAFTTILPAVEVYAGIKEETI